MPELDGWEYYGIQPRDGRAYVCCAYVAAVYKAAGLFDETVNPSEFGSADIYELKFFDKNYLRP